MVIRMKCLNYSPDMQQDIFQLVGAPLVENCLAGFNSSVFAYGQVYFLSFAALYP